MSPWQPTIGKWEDEENYTISAPLYQQALRFARTWHEEAGNASYGEFLCQVMQFLSAECNLSGYDILTCAALHGLLDETQCCPGDVEDELGAFAASLAQNMALDGEDLSAHIAALLADGEIASVLAEIAAQIVLARREAPTEEAKAELLSAAAPLKGYAPFALLLEKLSDTIGGDLT